MVESYTRFVMRGHGPADAGLVEEVGDASGIVAEGLTVGPGVGEGLRVGLGVSVAVDGAEPPTARPQAVSSIALATIPAYLRMLNERRAARIGYWESSSSKASSRSPAAQAPYWATLARSSPDQP